MMYNTGRGDILKRKIKNIMRNVKITFAILVSCLLVCIVLQNIFEEDNALIPSVFVLGAFLTAVITDGYFYGIAAALVSVLAVNYAFTFPFFSLDFAMPENIISAAILLAVTIVTCGLTTKIKRWEAIKSESEKERMRANLLRAVSHDLRTPLTTIYGSSSALLDNYGEFSDEQCRQMLKGICEDSQGLIQMVENLLSVTRLDGANVEIVKTNTAVDELVDSVLVKFAKRYPNQKVQVRVPEELVFVSADALLIEQVIMNMLENAVLHAEGMTKLSLKVYSGKGKVLFEIKDNGCGIPDDRMENIFNGLYCDTQTSGDGKKKNTGIGLSVCASIIKAHGGEITVENRKSGGCSFCFLLDEGDFEND